MKRPWHLWVIGILSLLWNAGGAYDYLMSQTHNADYLAMLGPEQLAFLDNAPMWFDVAWAFGVWGSIAGSLLLLATSRHALTTFALSLAGLVVSAIYSWGIADPSMIDLAGAFSVIFSAAICLIIILLWVYARAMIRRGVLR